MNAYIYYKMDSETESDSAVVREYFENIGWDVHTEGLHSLVTTDESERKADGMGDDGLYFDAVLEDLKPLLTKLNKEIDYKTFYQNVSEYLKKKLLKGEIL